MTKVLVTGGSGFIGKEIVKELLKRGLEVNVFDLNDSKIKGANYYQGSVLDMEATSKAMLGCDYVIHMAAILGVSKSTYAPVECLDVNILGTRNVLRCCSIHNVKKVLFPSSSEVYGEPVKIPVTEDTLLQPKSEYGVSKYVSEEYFKAYRIQYGLDYTIVRYFNVYGEEQTHGWVMAKFANNAILGRPLQIFGDGSQVRAFCHVKDAAYATVEALLNQKANSHTINIGNSNETISIKELSERVLYSIGRNDGSVMIPLENSDRTKEREIFKRIPSTEKARELLGFTASITLDDGIKMLMDYKKSRLDEIRISVDYAEECEKRMRIN